MRTPYQAPIGPISAHPGTIHRCLLWHNDSLLNTRSRQEKTTKPQTLNQKHFQINRKDLDLCWYYLSMVKSCGSYPLTLQDKDSFVSLPLKINTIFFFLFLVLHSTELALQNKCWLVSLFQGLFVFSLVSYI